MLKECTTSPFAFPNVIPINVFLHFVRTQNAFAHICFNVTCWNCIFVLLSKHLAHFLIRFKSLFKVELSLSYLSNALQKDFNVLNIILNVIQIFSSYSGQISSKCMILFILNAFSARKKCTDFALCTGSKQQWWPRYRSAHYTMTSQIIKIIVFSKW